MAEPVAAEPNQAAPTDDIMVPTHGRNSVDDPILPPDLGSDGKNQKVAFSPERESNVVSAPGQANDALIQQLKNNGIADRISRVYSDMRKTRPGLALSPTVKLWFIVDDQGKAHLKDVDMNIMKTIMPGEKPYDEATRQSIEADFEQAIRVACQRLPSLPKAPEGKVYLLRYPLYINVVN
ncbi:MAG: hypothetical protein HYU99_01680 [Deltaproteobacteria bacterium]|nr:hypothetical protein [Deltaproteobacteria bacterium]